MAINSNLAAIIRDAATRYGVSPETMMQIAQIESHGNPNARNPNSSAGGLYQFTDGTAKQYGLKNRYDPVQASNAAAHLIRDNAAALRQSLGRDPTPGELYLAHQQGAGGAEKLLSNPNANAAAIVGQQAVRLNGGRPDMSAGDFANLWTGKFSNTNPERNKIMGGMASGLASLSKGIGQGAGMNIMSPATWGLGGADLMSPANSSGGASTNVQPQQPNIIDTWKGNAANGVAPNHAGAIGQGIGGIGKVLSNIGANTDDDANQPMAPATSAPQPQVMPLRQMAQNQPTTIQQLLASLRG